MAAITKYFIGGELEAFVQGSDAATTWTTGAATYDADFSRGAVSLTQNNNVSYINIPLTSAQTTCWASFQSYRDSNSFSALPTNSTWMDWRNDSAVSLFRVQGVGGTFVQPLVAFQAWSGSAWVTQGTPIVVPTNARHKWDFRLTLAASGGVAACYVDGLLLGQQTGNTAPVSPANILTGRLYTTGDSFVGFYSVTTISECQVLDVSTLGRRLATLGETANGINTAWTGAYTDINEVGTFNDSNFIQSGTANQVSTFVTSDLSATAATYNVSGLVIAGRALNGAVGPQNLKGACVIGGTTYITTNNVAGPFGLPTVFGYVWADFPNNPATGVDFTPTEINTVGFETGWKSIT